MTGPSSTQAVLAEVISMIRVVVDEDEFEMMDEVTMETSFDQDLELESIEFVALAEELMKHYGEEVDFLNWIADMELDEIIEMTVGSMVEFIVEQQQATHLGEGRDG